MSRDAFGWMVHAMVRFQSSWFHCVNLRMPSAIRSGDGNRWWGIGIIALWFGCLCVSSAADAQQPTTTETAPTLPLPLRDRSGRPLRPIGVYLSQIVHLVPEEFRAVSIDELRKAIGNEPEKLSDADQARLVSGFYDISLDGQLLVSGQSKLVIEHRSGAEIRHKLGRVNLAIAGTAISQRSAMVPLIGNVPRLEVDHEGELVAVIPRTDQELDSLAGSDDVTLSPDDVVSVPDFSSVDGWLRSEVRFGWTLASRALGTVKKFELNLPRTAQTRLVISTPSDIDLEAAHGVLVERPGPPPDADVQKRTGDIRWFVLEAGGLNRIEIYAKRRTETDANQPLFVRRESKQYDIDLSGVSWIHRMTIQLPRQRNRVRLRSPLGTVTAVRVNSAEAQYQVLPRTDGQTLIDIELPASLAGRRETIVDNSSGGASQPVLAATELVTLTIEGLSKWSLTDGICQLPSVTPLEPHVIWTEASTQAIVTIMEPLEIVQWELPSSWRQSIQAPSRAGETLLIAEGSPTHHADVNVIWSKLKLIEKEERSIDAVWTRLRVQQTPSSVIRSSSRIRCRLLQNHQSPFRMTLNPDWTIDSVLIVGSGRRINTAGAAEELVIWPTSSESAQATFEIEVNAQQSLPRNRNRLSLASTWVIRPDQHVGQHVISIQPPSLRRWDGNSVMIEGRFESSRLDEESTAFFQPTPETLLLQSSTGEIPAVTLEAVDESFGVALRHLIETEGNDLSETIIVRAETTQPISQLTVLTGQSQSQDFSWSLRRTDQSATVSLPAASVERTPNDPLGTYVISLEGRDLRQFELVGRRYFAVDDELTLSLPSVRRTASQTAEVMIDAGWQVVSIPPSVQLVPGSETSATSEPVGLPAQYLRYDPLDRPEIQLRRSNPESAACLIWNRRFDVVVNCRSEDLFHLHADVSTLKPIHVTYDDELEIVAVTRNGRDLDPQRVGPGEFYLDPEKQSDQVSVWLRRRHANREWFRRCLIPQVDVEGQVMRDEVVCQTGAETLLLHQRQLSRPGASDAVLQATELLMIPREIAIGIGWLAAGILFCIAWSIARWMVIGVRMLFVLVVLSISASIIWWPWQVAILGWVAMPMLTAALLHVVLKDRQPNLPIATGSNPSRQLDDTQSHRNARDPSVDFSASIPFTSLLLGIVLALAASGWLMAQTSMVEEPRRMLNEDVPGNGNRAEQPIELLVPLDERHEPIGDKVYMSAADYESIRSVMDPDRAVDAMFQSAEYHVVLTPPRDAGVAIEAEVQADYQIQLARESTLVQLPIRAETVRRIEWVSDGDTQIVRFTVNERGTVMATIPSSRSILLRVTYVASIQTIAAQGTSVEVVAPVERPTSDPSAVNFDAAVLETTAESPPGVDASGVASTTIRLAVPAIHSANLIIEAPSEILVESLGEPLGRSLSRPELGRYEADLGPIRELFIRCRPNKRLGQTTSQAMRRAYRISAGIEATIVECEIQPEEKLALGDFVQLTILASAAPILTSSDWSLVTEETAELTELSTAATSISKPGNGIYRFQKQTGDESPIRMLWSLPSVLNDPTSTDDSKTMPIPEVYASASTRAAPTMFAIEWAESIRVAELAKGAQPVSEAEFLAAWRGYPGKIQRAFVIRDAFPSFVLLQDKHPAPTVRMEHRLHVAETKMELRLNAELIDLRPRLRRLSVLVPDRFRVLSCTVNDEPITSMTSLPFAASDGQARELALGDNRVNGRTVIELVAESLDPIRGQSPLPRFLISSDGEIDEDYRITRQRSLGVSLVKPANESIGADQPSLWKPSELTQADLLAGRVPVAFSDAGLGQADETKILISRRAAGSVFTCDQTIRMRYAAGQWFCDTLLEMPAEKVPDYVDLQLPTRWAADLVVYGASIWGKRESSDSAITVVRVALPIQPAPAVAGNPSMRHVQITGSLNNRDQIRVSVPVITVLGVRLRNQVIAVPGQLTTETIQWRAQSVRALKSDAETFRSFANRVESPERYTFYTPIERNWSIQLEPLVQATVNPTALSCDARVFLDGERAYVHQRFDILPETRSEIEVKLPPGAVCVGLWSAGREVDLHPLQTQGNTATQNEATQNTATLRIPLSYSRLPQSLEVLIKVAVGGRRTTQYLCELSDVPTEVVWIAYYAAPLGDENRRLMPEPILQQSASDLELDLNRIDRERSLMLAESVVTAIDRSRDMLAERSDEEIKRWLFPWIARYRLIASRNGHLFQFSDALEPPQEVTAESPPISETEKQWAFFDERLLQLAGRFLQADPVLPLPLFAQERFTDYQLIAVTRGESMAQAPALIQTYTQHKSLQQLLLNAITLLTFGLAVILMWPFRGRFRSWIDEPAMWLFVVGFVTLFLIPVPIAAMLMVVAISVPLIHWYKANQAA